MIQILGLRPYTNQFGVEDIKHEFFDQGWGASTVEELFRDLPSHLAKIPTEELWNLFFTVGNCHGKKPRDFSHQDILPIDIDHVDLEKIPETIQVVLKTLGLEYAKTGILCSGNGLQLFIKMPEVFKENYFKEKRIFYKFLCGRVNDAIIKAGLKGQADPSVFSPRRLMRLAGTQNWKKDKEIRNAYMIQSVIEPQGFSLEKASGVETVEQTDQISLNALKRFPKPDTQTILKECEFIKWNFEKPHEVSEPEWYAAQSIVGHLENGKELVHKMSSGHPSYNPDQTDAKLEQAITVAGPRTCKNINEISNKCSGCKHFNTDLKSPILIQGLEYIKTKDTGFHDVLVTDSGKVAKKPNFNDLHKYFKNKHKYFVESESHNIYCYTGTHWEEIPHLSVKAFAEDHFNPKPTEAMRSEFLNKVLSNNVKSKEWVDKSTDGKINLRNGVFCIETGTLTSHSSDYFFTGVLPYDYDPLAKAPRFGQFMDEITCNKKDVKKVLLEFSGYAISGDKCWLHKALVLSGKGSNGKSTYMEVLKALVGEKLYAALSLTAIEDDRKRYMLVGKLFNVGEETHVAALSKSESFKTLVSGGEMDTRRLYQQPFLFRNKAKLIFACNSLPYSSDNSDGFYRRLVIIPFNAKFGPENGENKNLIEELLTELPGILNIMIDSYRDLKARKNLPESKVLQDELIQYRNQNDLVYGWWRECVEVTKKENDFVTTDEMFQNFDQFCENRKTRFRYSFMEFSKWLANNMPEGVSHAKKYINRKQKHGYQGIHLEGDF